MDLKQLYIEMGREMGREEAKKYWEEEGRKEAYRMVTETAQKVKQFMRENPGSDLAEVIGRFAPREEVRQILLTAYSVRHPSICPTEQP